MQYLIVGNSSKINDKKVSKIGELGEYKIDAKSSYDHQKTI